MTRIRSRRDCSRDRTTIRSDSAPARTSKGRWSSPASALPRLRFRTQFYLADYVDRIRIPAVQISPALASSLIRGTNRTLEELSRSAESPRPDGPLPIPGPQVTLTVSVNRHIVPDRSIVALLEGSDPQLKQEVVIVSAHHDHEGADGAQVFNGADDNASGSVAVIDIADTAACIPTTTRSMIDRKN